MIKIKKINNTFSQDEINSFINNLDTYSMEDITEWLKAIKTFGLSDEETSNLTLAMAKSGQILSWDGLEPTIDKHSTGGIGDKITLLFAPLISACGINIPKLSGRGLGITGGTIDKLESISGFRTNLSLDEIKSQLKNIGIVVTGAMKNLAPADKKLYAIRDVTNTVDSIPLIASSVMSKKIATGSNNIILDVKCGSGAFMKTEDEAVLLAQKMVAIGKHLNKNIKACVTYMNEPLGFSIGNSLEIEEVLEVLNGKEVQDLVELTVFLAKEALELLSIDVSLEKLKRILLGGEALSKFEKMIEAQGGNLNIPLPKSEKLKHYISSQEGYLQNIDAYLIGEVVHDLGAGRHSVEDKIDYGVGIRLLKKRGDFVKAGENILELHVKNDSQYDRALEKLNKSITIGNVKPVIPTLVKNILC